MKGRTTILAMALAVALTACASEEDTGQMESGMEGDEAGQMESEMDGGAMGPGMDSAGMAHDSMDAGMPDEMMPDTTGGGMEGGR